jgi:hypothetical protein
LAIGRFGHFLLRNRAQTFKFGRPTADVTVRAHCAYGKGPFAMKPRLVRIATAIASLATLAVVTGASHKFH